MKSITLIDGENYPYLIAYISSNNFGDQTIDFVKESDDGLKTHKTFIRS